MGERWIALAAARFVCAAVLLFEVSSCQPERPLPKPSLVLSFELNEVALSEGELAKLRSFAAAPNQSGFLAIQGIACDIGGPPAALTIARRRGEKMAMTLHSLGWTGARVSTADPIVLPGLPREPHRRVELYQLGSLTERDAAIVLLNRRAQQINAVHDGLPEVRGGTDNAPATNDALRRALQAVSSPVFWGLLPIAFVILILIVGWFGNRRRLALLRDHQFADGERERLGLPSGLTAPPSVTSASAQATAAVVAQTTTEKMTPATTSPGADRVEDPEQYTPSRTPTMSKKKKTTGRGPSIRGALDREFEHLTLSELAKAPVNALEGLTPRHARLLEEGFGVRTLEDLSRLKYVEIARAIVVLSEFEK